MSKLTKNNSEFEVEFGLEIRIRSKSMVEFGHEVIECGQKMTF
jgi:hypothetical protein